jgi:hypothetical protein
MVPKEKAENVIVNAAFLGRVLGISRASIANLATDGILPRADRGLFDLPACARPTSDTSSCRPDRRTLERRRL